MANSLLKLTVESSEYDAKLKKAAEGVRHLADVAHKSAGDMTGLEQSTLDYIKSIGEMETKSRSAAGQVRELESTYKELKVIYDQLNEVEKADEGGKALAASLEQLKLRAQDARTSLDQASKSLQENADAGKEDSSALEALASKFTLNIDALKLFDMGLTAAKAALDVAKDAFFASETNVDEWGRTVQSAQGLYEGFLNAINNGDISGYLDRMDQIMRAARAAYDELDKLGTMKTIQSPQKSAQQTENDRMRMMLQTGRYIAPVDGRKASMQDGQKLTKAQLQAIEKQLQNGMKTVTTLIGNEVKQSGKAIDAYYNSLAKQNGMTMTEFRKGTSNWAEFSKKMAGYDAYKEWDKKARAEFARQGGRGNVDFDKSNPYAEFKKWGTFRVDKQGANSYNDLVNLIQQRDQQSAQAYQSQGQMYRTMNRVEGKFNPKGGNTQKQEQTEFQQNQKKINDLTQQYVELSKKGLTTDDERLVKLRDEIKELEKRNGLLSLRAEQAHGRLMPQAIDLNAKGVNRTMFGDLGLTQKPKGLDKPAQLDEKALKAVQKNIQKQTDLQVKELKQSKKEDKSLSTGIGNLAGGMTSVVSGLEQLGIEIPQGLKDVIGGVQSVISIISGIATMVAAIEALSAINAAKPLANGGIVHAAGGWNGFVPGNNYSGDMVPALLNSGELVLNRAQQGVLASELSGAGMQNLRLEAVVSGEQILLASNNRGRRTGRGEIVQSRRVR